MTAFSLDPFIIKGCWQLCNNLRELRQVKWVYSSSLETIHGLTPFNIISSITTLFLRWIGFWTPNTPSTSSCTEVKLCRSFSSYMFSMLFELPSFIVKIKLFVSSIVSFLFAYTIAWIPWMMNFYSKRFKYWKSFSLFTK